MTEVDLIAAVTDALVPPSLIEQAFRHVKWLLPEVAQVVYTEDPDDGSQHWQYQTANGHAPTFGPKLGIDYDLLSDALDSVPEFPFTWSPPESDEQIIAAVTAKLAGELHVGATVFTKNEGRMCEVRGLRECAHGGQWVRVRFMNNRTGNWEYHSSDLVL